MDEKESYSEYEERLEKMTMSDLMDEEMTMKSIEDKFGHFKLYNKYKCHCGKRMREVPGSVIGRRKLYQCPGCKFIMWIEQEIE